MSEVNLSTAGHVGTVELNRAPDNFFDKVLIGAIADAFDQFERDGMRAVVLCAAGKNFCAGANFSRPAEDTVEPGGTSDHLYRQAVKLFRCKLPVVAAVQGAAIGGGLGLAMVGDFRVATPQSRFSANFARLGFHCGFGLSITLPRAIGMQAASLLFYTGRRIGGEEAHRLGLVDELVAPEELRPRAAALAEEIATSAPLAVQSMRATFRRGLVDEIAAITDHELAQQQRQFETEDFREGVKAMAERRPPRFAGR